MAQQRILIMAGGTGGHVFPALTVAKQLRAGGHEVMWLGTAQGMESQWVPAQDIELFTISMTGLRRSGIKRWLAMPFTLTRAVIQAASIIRRCRPDVVLGMGSFASAPGGLVARLLGKKLVLHEQNAIPCMTNRLLRPLAHQVGTAFPQTFKPGQRIHPIGNPLRVDIINLPPPEQRFADREGPLRILVLGGSRGALALNQLVPQALAQLPFPVEVRHQSGESHIDAARTAYQTAAISADIVAFMDDMAAAYCWTDLVICRAGAMTIAELTAVGVAALLIPYPFAVDDHQSANAKFLVDGGAAQLLPQATLTAEQLSQAIVQISVPQQRLQMAKCARALCQADAAQQLMNLVLDDN
ncbi:MAG: undecaprenyldiphospho-muramoylpentapeptide beta-N-acetylglucosaminyltransferase [Gammaproteobacteria bacterium]|nr:undecaprenyldiphospho-muramoylpentapeptide beta-N-acetylglucosaminyltransferase [Gammaproteobacteria bacterium]